MEKPQESPQNKDVKTRFSSVEPSSGEATSPPTPASAKRKPGRKANRRKRLEPVSPEKGLSIERTLEMFRESGVEDLQSWSSLRRAFHDKKIAGFIHGKNRIYFNTTAVLEVLGAALSKKSGSTIDQELLIHYRESEMNNPFSAVEKRIAPTLSKAIQVFNDFNIAKQNPFIAASERARLAHEGKPDQENAKTASAAVVETPCSSCGRTLAAAREDHSRVSRAATGGREDLDLNEERALAKFQGARCAACWTWLAHAPIALMQQELHMFSTGKDPVGHEPVSSTSADASGVTTADGLERAPEHAHAPEVSASSRPESNRRP